MSQEQLQRKKSSKLLKMALSADYWEEQSLLLGGVGIMAVTNPANHANNNACYASLYKRK